ncbi:MAG: hypothetical protein VZR54_04295 [Ruminococcus sp.]|nr:hypothetical protein [Ruminococcus sp.]
MKGLIMNYKEWSDEYFRDAENLKKTIRKYEAIAKNSSRNLEKINTIIFSYRNIYYDILNTGKMLRERAGGAGDNAA